MCMARHGDEAGTAGPEADWLGPLFEQLKSKLQEAAEKVCAEDITSAAEAEKVGRAAGVIARSAKAVDALRLRAEAIKKEDEMGGRTYDPEDDERIRQELLIEHERLDRILEKKRSEAADRARAKAGASLVPALGAPVSSA